MSNIKDFADQLQQDVVSDIADSYFGARKNVENMLTVYAEMVTKFQAMTERLNRAAATLHALLLDEGTARDFYVAIGADPSAVVFPGPSETLDLGPVPFAFTRKGRYEKCVLRAYDRLQKVADEYLHGRYFDNPDDPGRKRLTIHYLRLKSLAEYINDEIGKVNNQVTASGILSYVKGMDPELAEREQIMGGVSLSQGGALDADMGFTPVDFDGLHLPETSELPPLRTVSPAVRSFAEKTYAAHESEADRVVDELRRMSIEESR